MRETKDQGTCKNCEYCSPSYRGGVCQKNGRNKRVKYSGSCTDWSGKKYEPYH